MLLEGLRVAARIGNRYCRSRRAATHQGRSMPTTAASDPMAVHFAWCCCWCCCCTTILLLSAGLPKAHTRSRGRSRSGGGCRGSGRGRRSCRSSGACERDKLQPVAATRSSQPATTGRPSERATTNKGSSIERQFSPAARSLPPAKAANPRASHSHAVFAMAHTGIPIGSDSGDD